MPDIAPSIEAYILATTRARIHRKIAAWGLHDLVRPRILAPLGIPSIDEATASDLETIEHLLSVLTLWSDTFSPSTMQRRLAETDDDSAPATIE